MEKTTLRRASRSDGIHSREMILNAAARLATIEGLEGMSIGRLAEHIGMSKSGLYAHFGSKEELQLATVETASRIFAGEVITPTEAIGDPVARLEALADAFLDHLERDVFPGGCFFISATAEFDTRPGPVLDLVTSVIQGWTDLFAVLVRQAQEDGVLSKDENPEQLAWELDAFLLMGNMGWVTTKETTPLVRARLGFRRRLAAARAVTAVS
jgi:AcrR family transcriptional regulator